MTGYEHTFFFLEHTWVKSPNSLCDTESDLGRGLKAPKTKIRSYIQIHSGTHNFPCLKREGKTCTYIKKWKRNGLS